ncbi:PDZ domain-containing protein [Dysgonomonas massiliensis]|uniref:PDZ domain-containing protein n=1 Tax=Dysgonomonas massiliensis TaxID=2040292 RepID=UPI000C79181A|nr:PDZ domain-containing protein [Dysgonomonas massiliensis]
MTKRIFLLLSIIALSITTAFAQFSEKQCYYGITFEISKNQNWGFGELVITDVEANSPAEQAGIKIGDIIMEINGKATYLRDNQTIASWLFDGLRPEVTFTIRNMGAYFKEYPLMRRCIAVNSLSEQQLSSLFSLYSLENTHNRTFTLPISVTPTKDVNFTDYHTFDFYQGDNTNLPPIDGYIANLLASELEAKGLKRDTKDPDMLIQTYYYYYPNARFTGLESLEGTESRLKRFDVEKQKMVSLPIFDHARKDIEAKSQFVVEYGFSFYDRKYIDSTRITQIWDCSIKDYLGDKMELDEYVRIHTPLMLMQFPYTTTKKESAYQVRFNKYNYTGMYFDADNLTTVSDVIPNSPAYRAGIRAGHVIRRINGIEFAHTKETLTKGYQLFVADTKKYRDESTRFTNSEGYEDCMFWNKPYYSEIAKAFSKKVYQAHFSYLYNFEPYINSRNGGTLTIETWDGMQNRLFSVTPEVKQSVILRTIDKQ